MKTTLLALAVAGGALLAATPAAAQFYFGNQWRVIGYKTVNGHDTDTIRVRGDHRFRQVKVCAYGAPVRMRDLDIRFANGKRQDVNVRSWLAEGTCTRNIDLKGNRRDIANIVMKYDPIARSYRRPVVRVQAR